MADGSLPKRCITDGCDSAARTRDRCNLHYQRMLVAANRRLDPITRPCKRCGAPVGWGRNCAASLCVECRKNWRWCPACEAPWDIEGYKVKTKVFTLPCPMHVRDEQLKFRMGISLEIYSDLLRAQDGTCAIEGCDEWEDLHVDHDHSCCPQRKACKRCVRGLVCARHNHALGKVRDSVAELEALAQYLIRFHSAKPGEVAGAQQGFDLSHRC